jgi:hypothetical protein
MSNNQKGIVPIGIEAPRRHRGVAAIDQHGKAFRKPFANLVRDCRRSAGVAFSSVAMSFII